MTSKKHQVTSADVEAILKELTGSPTGKPYGNHRVSGVKQYMGKVKQRPVNYGPYNRAKLPKDAQTGEYLTQMRRADQDSRNLGEPRKEKKSWFNRTIDVLSRGNFASAEAFKEAFDPKTKAFWEPKEGLKGFVSGLKGKEKTTFSDVLDQHGHKGKGMGTLGLALDIVADPLTWTGVGTVAKAGVSSKKAVDVLNEVGKAQAKIAKNANAPLDAVRTATQSQNLPSDIVKKRHLKNLSPEGRALYDSVVDMKPAGPSSFTASLIKKYSPKTNAYTRKTLAGMPDKQASSLIESAVEEQLKKYPTLRGYIDIVRRRDTDDPGTMAWANRHEKTLNIGQGLADMPTVKSTHIEELGSNWASVKAKSPEEFLKAVVVHEVGHHVSYNMSDEVVNTIRERIFKEAGANPSKKPFKWDEASPTIPTVPPKPILTQTPPPKAAPSTAGKLGQRGGGQQLKSYPKVAQKAIRTALKDAGPGGFLKLSQLKYALTKYLDKGQSQGLRNDLYYADITDLKGKIIATPEQIDEYFDSVDDAMSLTDNVADDVVTNSDKVREYLADNLSEYSGKNIKETMAEAWAEAELMGSKARPLSKWIAEEMKRNIPKAPTFKETSKILKELADDAVANKLPTHVNDILNVKVHIAAKEQSKVLHEQLLAITARNMSTGVKKQFQLKIGPTAVGIPKSYEAVTKAAAAVGSIPGIKQSVDKFNELFRASAHIPKGLDHLRAKSTGSSMFVITQHLKLLQSIFDKVPAAERKSVMKAIKDGALQGNKVRGGLDLNGNPVEDLVSYVRDELALLDISRLDSGLTLDEINSFLGNKYKITTPEHKLVETKVKRINEYGQEFEATKVTKSQEANPTAIFDAIMSNPRVNDPAQALYLYSAAVNQAVAKKNLWTTIAQTHGVPKNELGEQLAKKHGWVPSTVGDTKEFYFPPEVAEGIAKIDEVFKNERSTGQLIDQYDRALQTFKSVVTRYNPSFHSRTLLGEYLLGYMGGMKNMRRSYSKSMQVLKGRNEQFMGKPSLPGVEFGEGASKGLIQASNVLRNANPAKNPNLADGSKTLIQHKKYGALTADKIWHLYLETGLKSGYAATDLVRGANAPVGGKLTSARNMMQTATESVEDVGRLAHFIDVIQHSKAKTLEEAVEEAAQVTRKFHLDYTNVTNFERNVMTRAMPFYKWMRLSTPVMAEILLTQPGKALALPKAMREISDMAGYDTENFGPFPGGADAVIPEWLRDHGAVPIFEAGGNTNYFDPTAIFPLAGSVETGETGGLKMLSPFAKWGADIYHGKDKFGNQLTGENATGKERLNYILAQTPQTNFANQMITKRDPGIPRWQSVAQFLANPGIQPNTEKRMRGEAFRQRQEAYSHRKELKKERGLIP